MNSDSKATMQHEARWNLQEKKPLRVSSLQYFLQSWELISIFFKTEIDDSLETM